jgi:hypothetical protein
VWKPVRDRPVGCRDGSSSNLWFCTRWVWVRVYFYTCDLNLNPTRVEPGLIVGFIFNTWVHLKQKKNLKSERNPKPERNLKKLETRKKPEKTPFTKPNRHLKPDAFGCQILPAGSGVKFNPTIFFYGSGFRSTRPEPDPLPSLVGWCVVCVELSAVGGGRVWVGMGR